jgi:hypothetical protein
VLRRPGRGSMSDVVCQLNSQAKQAELIWSSRGGFFRPYSITNGDWDDLRDRSDKARLALEHLVLAHNSAGTGTVPGDVAYRLAEAGFDLYNALLPRRDETARRIRRWLKDLREQFGTVDLEVVVEEPSGDTGAWLSIPWNLVYDELPDKFKESFRTESSTERWWPFWSVRYNLTSGRRVEPWQRMPIWEQPRVVVVVDQTVYKKRFIRNYRAQIRLRRKLLCVN